MPAKTPQVSQPAPATCKTSKACPTNCSPQEIITARLFASHGECGEKLPQQFILVSLRFRLHLIPPSSHLTDRIALATFLFATLPWDFRWSGEYPAWGQLLNYFDETGNAKIIQNRLTRKMPHQNICIHDGASRGTSGAYLPASWESPPSLYTDLWG